jgi:hypothetical protein
MGLAEFAEKKGDQPVTLAPNKILNDGMIPANSAVCIKLGM